MDNLVKLWFYLVWRIDCWKVKREFRARKKRIEKYRAKGQY